MCYQSFQNQLPYHKCIKYSNCVLEFINSEWRSHLLLRNLTEREIKRVKGNQNYRE